MSRKGVARSRSPLTIRIRPACSTTKRRPEPSPAPVTKRGAWSPLATVVRARRREWGSPAAGEAREDGPPSALVPAGDEGGEAPQPTRRLLTTARTSPGARVAREGAGPWAIDPAAAEVSPVLSDLRRLPKGGLAARSLRSGGSRRSAAGPAPGWPAHPPSGDRGNSAGRRPDGSPSPPAAARRRGGSVRLRHHERRWGTVVGSPSLPPEGGR